MKAVERCLAEEKFDWIVQESHMSEQEKETFLGAFEQKYGREQEGRQEKSLVAFCVMGGVFSEGIDLKGDQLIGAVIVGTGLPMVCTEQTILKDYFDQDKKQGFDFAYRVSGYEQGHAGGRAGDPDYGRPWCDPFAG